MYEPRVPGRHGALYALDIETDTAGEAGLDPSAGRITEIAVAAADQEWVFNDPDESKLLGGLAAWADNPEIEPGVIVTWNGASFDWPFIAARAARHGVDLPWRLVEDPTAGGLWPSPGWTAQLGAQGHADIMRPWRRFADEHQIRCRLKAVAEEAGVKMVHVDRERMHALSGDERREYVLSDVRGTLALAEMLGELRCDPYPVVAEGADPLTGQPCRSGLIVIADTLDPARPSPRRSQGHRCGHARNDGQPCRQRVATSGAACPHHS